MAQSVARSAVTKRCTERFLVRAQIGAAFCCKLHPKILDKSLTRCRCAAMSGSVRAVRTLLLDARVDPSASDSQALKWAAKGRHTDVRFPAKIFFEF